MNSTGSEGAHSLIVLQNVFPWRVFRSRKLFSQELNGLMHTLDGMLIRTYGFLQRIDLSDDFNVTRFCIFSIGRIEL